MFNEDVDVASEGFDTIQHNKPQADQFVVGELLDDGLLQKAFS